MAKIPAAELERLKRDIPLTRLVEASGIALKKSGKDLLGLCPFHDEKTPSLVISETKNVFHCFGCGAKGTVIDWKMKTEGLSFRHAVEKLRAEYSSLTADTLPTDHADQSASNIIATPIHSSAAAMPLNLHEAADDQELLSQVIAFYHATLKESPEALAYLKQRGLHDVELIETFKLGYANRTLGYRLPVRKHAAQGGIRSQLQRLFEMEYILVHHGSRGQRYDYELLYDGQGQDNQGFLIGLMSTDSLKEQITLQSSRGASSGFAVEKDKFAGGSRPVRGVVAGTSRTPEHSEKTNSHNTLTANHHDTTKNAVLR